VVRANPSTWRHLSPCHDGDQRRGGRSAHVTRHGKASTSKRLLSDDPFAYRAESDGPVPPALLVRPARNDSACRRWNICRRRRDCIEELFAAGPGNAGGRGLLAELKTDPGPLDLETLLIEIGQWACQRPVR
jgi:hypothetical protein